jgi:hypothetical protein
MILEIALAYLIHEFLWLMTDDFILKISLRCISSITVQYSPEPGKRELKSIREWHCRSNSYVQQNFVRASAMPCAVCCVLCVGEEKEKREEGLLILLAASSSFLSLIGLRI